jgi:hypothetical protein
VAKLPKFTLSWDKKRENWKLENDKTDKVVRRFHKKSDATGGGVLKKALGDGGGSVKIHYKTKPGYEEERTFPRSRDPRSSKG